MPSPETPLRWPGSGGNCPVTGKMRYPGRRPARTALNSVRGQGRSERHYYWCRFCDGYHLTSRAQTRKRPARPRQRAGVNRGE
jgi:hypothetical protein